MASHPPLNHRLTRRFDIALPFLAVLILLIGACNLPLGTQPTATPVVITVLVPAPTQPTSTDAPVTFTPGIPSPTDTITPPPAPEPPQVTRGGPQGDGQTNYRWSFDFTPSYFLRMYVFYSEDPNEKFKPSKDGRGIASVEFNLTSPDGGKQFYDRVEKNAGYCFFGGGEPDCNAWTMEGGQYVWKAGGHPVKSGKYALTITVTPTKTDADVGTWLWDAQDKNLITITVP